MKFPFRILGGTMFLKKSSFFISFFIFNCTLTVSIQNLIDHTNASQRPTVTNGVLNLEYRNIDSLTGLSSVTNIGNVTHLYLGNNPLSGDLDLSACTSLTNLYLNNCSFTTFPTISSEAIRNQIQTISFKGNTNLPVMFPNLGIGNYTFNSLIRLNLDNTNRTGFLALSSSLGNIKGQLIELVLANNPLLLTTSPGTFSDYTSLQILNIGNTGLTEFPISIDTTIKSNLTHLTIDNNPNMGLPAYSVPADAVFIGFSSLIYLNIGGIGLDSTIGNNFAHLRNHVNPIKGQLTHFYFGYHSFGPGAIDLTGFTSLTNIGMQRVGATSFPAFDGTNNLPDIRNQITELQLGHGDSFSLPTFDNNWGSLTFLTLDNISSLNSFPTTELANIKGNLQFLSLRDNNFSLSVSDLSGFSSLQKLSLNNTLSTVPPSGAFSDCTSLQTLELSGSDFFGETLLSSTFNNLSTLTTLDISNCNLAGFDQFPTLSSLTRLLLNDNALTSLTSAPFQNLSNLRILDLSNNTDLNTLDNTTFTGLTHLEILKLTGLTNVTRSNYNSMFLYSPLTHLLELDLTGTLTLGDIQTNSPANGLRSGVLVKTISGSTTTT